MRTSGSFGFVSVGRGKATAIRWALSVAFALALNFLLAATAHAYPWMIRYGYTGCAGCHTDPSGAGTLTEFGRGRGELLWETGRERDGTCGASSEPCDPNPATRFLWGAVRVPPAVRLGGDFRGQFVDTALDGKPVDRSLLFTRADVAGDVELGRFRAAGSIGYADTGSLKAAITRGDSQNLVSREHWLGLE